MRILQARWFFWNIFKLNFLGLANFCFNCTLEAALNTSSERSKIPDYISLCERTLPGLADQTPALVRDSFKSESETCRLATSLQSPANLSHFPGDSSHKQHLLVNHFEERSFIFICFISSDKLLSIFITLLENNLFYFSNRHLFLCLQLQVVV